MQRKDVGWRGQRLDGFTLIELMVVVAIIGILATIGIPRFTTWILMGHLEEAKPYLMSIAAKQRVYMAQNGSYYLPVAGTTNCATVSESCLENYLGVNLKEAANFCFVVRTAAANANGDFISSRFNDADIRSTPRFEVWAILNNQQVAVDATLDVDPAPAPSVTCTLATGKQNPSGWVGASGTVGGQGRVVVLRYPPAGAGLDTADRSGRAGVQLDWIDGLSISDPLL